MKKRVIFLALTGAMIIMLCGSVSAADPPVTDFSANVTNGTTPLSVQFTDTSTNNATSWAWDFDNDGTTDSNHQNPTYTYNTPGNYSVKLTAGNVAGNNTLTKFNYINVVNLLPSNRHIFINVSNDEGVKYNTDTTMYGGPNGTYYIKCDGGGMNALHITNDIGNLNGQLTAIDTTNTNYSGVFYITDTGGRGYNDNIILLVSVKGPISDNFAIHITSSGYNWTATGSSPTSYQYVTNAVNQSFTKVDFQYGPQTAKPGPGTLGVWSLPLYAGQNINDPSTAEYLMFIDLYVGTVSNSNLINSGNVKIEYNITGMSVITAFNAYAWCAGSNQAQGISWTNNPSSSGYYINYIPPIAKFTATPTNGKTPLTVQFTDASTGNINSWAWDFNNDGIVDSTQQNPTYTYNNPGIYTVKLTVSGPYDSDSEIKTDFITITPVTNTRTNKTYVNIQSAIDDSETLDGDTILVGSGPYAENYSENVNVTKQLTIATRGKVAVTALDVNNPVFKISIGGTNSVINGFTITGATNSSGIYIDPFVNATIIGNYITGNLNGIYVGDGNVTIIGNNITGNSNNGVLIRNGNAIIAENNITGNHNGVYIEDSDDTTVSVRNNITENNITDNSNVGIYVGSGSPNIHYNRICNNGLYGLEDTAKGENTSNAIFNWWGNNTPMYVGRTSAPRKSDIYDAHESSHVTYDPWIVLTVNATSDLLKTGAKSNITADLTHDNNGNVVAGGQIPDSGQIVFAYALGTVSPVNTTLLNNTAKATVTGGSTSGIANITATVDGYTAGIPITMDTIAPIVSADVLGGTYNNTQTVTLTTNDPTSTIYYTINGTKPTTSSTPYTGPITINSTASLKFAALDPASNWSPVNIQNYLIGTTPIADSDWPKFQGDINNTGLSDYIGPQSNSTAWIYTTSNSIYYSAPVIGADGTIYIGNRRGVFYAINPDGTLKWSYSSSVSIIYGSAIIGGDGTIYFCGQYALYALNSNGTLKWNYNAGQTLYGSPTIGSDGTIYFGCYNGKLYAVNLDGTLKWTYTTGDYIYYSSPAIGADETIYIGSTDRKLYAINPDGTLKWSYQTDSDIHDSSPAIGADGTIYIGNRRGVFYAINPDGTLKWDYLVGSTIQGSPAIGADGTIYIGSANKNVYALNPDGTLKWKYATNSYVRGSPAIGADETIYFGSDDKNVYALNPDGTLKWKYTTGNYVQGSPAIGSDGTLYIGSYDYKLYAFKDPDADINTTVTVDNETHNLNDNLIIEFNVTNNGPGAAFKTILTYTLPEWLKYIDISIDMGSVSYNAATRIITWNIGDFKVVDTATMTLLTQVITSGTYTIIPSLETITDNPNLAANTGSATVTVIGNVVNDRTGIIYDTIQEAIDDANTEDGDTINVGSGNYTENVVISKHLVLNALGLVTVMPLDVNYPVFSISADSIINGFNITGATNSYGIYIAQFVNSTIINNTIAENGLDGIFINGSTSTANMSLNTIVKNTIRNNGGDGISIYAGSPIINSNNIYGNTKDGIRIQFGNPVINSNNIYGNTKDGIRVQSGSPVIQFNRIYNNGLYGLHDLSTTANITNATYNWWGTNNPKYVLGTTASGKTDIYDAHTIAHVTYNPWIVLTADVMPNILKAGAKGTITAYLTHDSNGNLITGQVPDGIPVNFSTDSGTINPKNTTSNGSASSTLTACNISCATNATVTVDACTVSVPVSVDTVAPTVTNNVPGGTYNSTPNVTLSADEPSTIYYTTNGTNPTTSSNVFTDPIAINITTTLRYAALDPAGNWSPIYLMNYVIGSGGLADTPQPEFQNNNNHTGQSDYVGPQTNTTAWNYNTGTGIYGYGSPTIGADGTIYIGNNAGVLYALNPDGTQKWNYTTGSSIRSSPAIGGDRTIYFSSGKIIYALNSNGTQKWNYTMGDSNYASPVINADGTIYIGSYDQNLYAINPDGTLKWTYTTESGTYSSGLPYSSPAIGADGTIYIGSENGKIYAINPDGTLKWKYKATFGNIRSSPSIGADGTIYFTIDSNLFAMNPDGTLKWKYTGSGSSWSTPAIGNNETTYFTMGKNVYALNSNGTLKWTYETNSWPYYSSPAIGADGTIYVATEANIFALNPDGTLKWNRAGSAYASTIGSDGTLYIAGQNGVLYAIKDPVPVANFTATPTNGTTPLTVQFNDTSSYAASWAWDFNNDGVVDSTERNPTYTYSSTGRYAVKLTVTNAAGSVSEIKTDYITVDNIAPVPSANLPSGPYNTDLTVNLTAVDDLDSNPQIYYTLDGSDPTTSSILYTGPININSEGTTTLKFIAVDATGNWSPVYNQTYTIDITIPTVTSNPVGGLFNTTQTISLTTNEPTTIYYTTDGTTPTTTSNQYTTPININTTTTLKFMAIDTAGNQGTVQTETYNIDTTPPTVQANPIGGNYNTTKTVVLNADDESATIIYYTIDGSDPTTSSNQYTTPININTTTTLKFMAIDAFGNQGTTQTETYNIDTTPPTVQANSVGGNYDNAQTITLTTNEPTTIYYTTDGTTPTTTSNQYTTPININTTTTLKFMAIDAAGNKGTVQSETYNIKSDVYVQITPSITNPQVGDQVTYTFKLGNNGPGDAHNIVFTYVIPEGVEYTGANVDQGTVNYDPTTRTLTWTVGNVAAGVDPYLWLNLNMLNAGTFSIQPTVTVAGYNPGLINNIESLLINATITPTNTENTNTVNAATTTSASAGTIPMQTTGAPLAGLILGILCIGSGITLSRKK